MKLYEYQTRDALMQAVSDAVAADLIRALKVKPTVTLAIPGGTTPGPVFDALSTFDLDWSRVQVLLSDERWVAEDSELSNAALIRKRFLVDRAAAVTFTPYFCVDQTIEAAARSLSENLKSLLPIDVLLLGMGADMHTASLFPGASGLTEAMSDDAPMLLPIAVEGQAIQRLTLSAPALRGAGATHLLITGEDKRTALKTAQTLDPMLAPIQTVLPNANVHWSAT